MMIGKFIANCISFDEVLTELTSDGTGSGEDWDRAINIFSGGVSGMSDFITEWLTHILSTTSSVRMSHWEVTSGGEGHVIDSEARL